jgi:hypothetical protein
MHSGNIYLRNGGDQTISQLATVMVGLMFLFSDGCLLEEVRQLKDLSISHPGGTTSWRRRCGYRSALRFRVAPGVVAIRRRVNGRRIVDSLLGHGVHCESGVASSRTEQ